MPAGDEVTLPTSAAAPVMATVKPYKAMKSAVTEFAAAMLTVQVLAVPLHAPPQPVNRALAVLVAASVTEVPATKGAAQTLPQLMPASDDFTVPAAAPDPVLATASV